MTRQTADIVRAVRVCLDKNVEHAALISADDIDTLTLDDIILSKIEDGVRSVEAEAPVTMLGEGHVFGDEVYWLDGGSGWVLLPDDFMRLIVFEMSDWERPVFEVLSPEDPRYVMQRGRWKGLRGNVQRPVCLAGRRNEGNTLEFYSSKDETAYVSAASYLPYPKIDKDGGIDVAPKCYAAAIYRIAALTLASIGEAEQAQHLTELSKNLLT